MWWNPSLLRVQDLHCWWLWSASLDSVSLTSILFCLTFLSKWMSSSLCVIDWLPLHYFCLWLAFVVAVNCWSVTLASRTQVTLTVIKMFALVLIIIPGVMALAEGEYSTDMDWDEMSSVVADIVLEFDSQSKTCLNFCASEAISSLAGIVYRSPSLFCGRPSRDTRRPWRAMCGFDKKCLNLGQRF